MPGEDTVRRPQALYRARWIFAGHNASLGTSLRLARATYINYIVVARAIGPIEQETPAGRELNVMHNRADGTRKITRAPRSARCGTRGKIGCASGAQVPADYKGVRRLRCTSCYVDLAARLHPPTSRDRVHY